MNSKRQMNLASVPRRASSGGTPSFLARFAVAKSRSPSSSSMRALSPEPIASSSSPSSSATLARAPAASGQSNPIRLAFSVSRSARASPGSSRGTPSRTLLPRPLASFSFFLIAAHCRRTPSESLTPLADGSGRASGLRASGPKTWGWRERSFSEIASATPPKSKRPSSSAIRAWKTIWRRRSPSSSRWASGSPASIASRTS